MRWTPYILTTIAAWLALLGVIIAMPVLSGVMTWGHSLADALTQWLPWMILSPGIFWFAARFPIGRMGLGGRLGLHLATALILVFFSTWASSRCLAPQLAILAPEHDEPNEARQPPRHPPDDHFHGPPHDHDPHGPPFWARA